MFKNLRLRTCLIEVHNCAKAFQGQQELQKGKKYWEAREK
jgi:hypothetical protein